MGKVHIGTMGWSYKFWVGNFYANGLNPKEFLVSARVRSDNVGRMTIGSQSGACRCVSWCQCKPWIRRQNAEAQEDGVDLICFWLKNTKPFYARSPYDVASH
jgi:hypothetical protein